MRGISTPSSNALLVIDGPFTILCLIYDINVHEVAIRTHQLNQCGVCLGALEAYLAFKTYLKVNHGWFSHLVLLMGLHTYSYPCSIVGINVISVLAMVVASGHRNMHSHEGDSHYTYSIRCYIESAVSVH